MPNLSAIFSSENVIVALIGLTSGAIGGTIGSMIAPLVNWRIEQKRQTRTYREAQIQKWRQMVHDVILTLDEIELGITSRPANVRSTAVFFLERHPDFYSLRPLLPHAVLAEVYTSTIVFVGSTLSGPLVRLVEEIARIEKEWGLR